MYIQAKENMKRVTTSAFLQMTNRNDQTHNDPNQPLILIHYFAKYATPIHLSTYHQSQEEIHSYN